MLVPASEQSTVVVPVPVLALLLVPLLVLVLVVPEVVLDSEEPPQAPSARTSKLHPSAAHRSLFISILLRRSCGAPPFPLVLRGP
jgi:hypothetical protein